jgi:hypothetical protein
LSKLKVRLLMAKEYLRQNPLHSTEDVMRHVRCSYRTVSTARKELRLAGEVPPSPWDRRSQKEVTEAALAAVAELEADPEKFEVTSTAQMLEAAEEEAQRPARGLPEPPDEAYHLRDMTPDEMKGVLVRLIRNQAMPPQIRIAAIAAKQKLDFEAQDRNALGPGPPLSREDARDRLGRLMKACGPELVHEAITVAFGGEANGQEEAVDPGQPAPTLETALAASGGESPDRAAA